MKTLDPHLLSAETDKLSVIPNGLNAPQNHVRNRVVRHTEVVADRCVYLRMWVDLEVTHSQLSRHDNDAGPGPRAVDAIRH